MSRALHHCEPFRSSPRTRLSTSRRCRRRCSRTGKTLTTICWTCTLPRRRLISRSPCGSEIRRFARPSTPCCTVSACMSLFVPPASVLCRVCSLAALHLKADRLAHRCLWQRQDSAAAIRGAAPLDMVVVPVDAFAAELAAAGKALPGTLSTDLFLLSRDCNRLRVLSCMLLPRIRCCLSSEPCARCRACPSDVQLIARRCCLVVPVRVQCATCTSSSASARTHATCPSSSSEVSALCNHV